MKQFIFGVVLALGAIGVQGQATPPPYSFSVAGLLANCPALDATKPAQFCFTGDKGFVQSIAGAAWAAPGGVAVTPALTINGTTKTLPASFTVSVTAPTISAPIITSANPTSSTPVASIPAVTVN